MKIRTLALASSVLTIALVLAGCSQAGSMDGMDHGSGADPSPSEASAEFNAADEMFVTMMIPHHEQAVEMADMILAKDGIDDRVVALAERIQAAQGPEIDTMTGWLDAWGVEPVDSGMDGMEGMDHGDGMMSDEDMAALESAEGAEAARLFLEQMIQHHQGAIDMAEAEVTNGINPDAVALANKIVDDQTAEIAEMEELLTQL
jgi:uncharacterized protein (DUF305 family)